MQNPKIYFNQTGEIHFNGKNWKNVVAAIPSEAKLLLISGIKNNYEVPITIVKTRQYRKSIKSMFLSKTLIDLDGQVIDRRMILTQLMEKFEYKSIKIRWSANSYTTNVFKLPENKLAA